MPLHNKTTSRAIEICDAVGATFWSLAPKGYLFGTRDGQFVEIRLVRQRAIVTATPVDAQGRTTGPTTEYPAPAGL